MVHSSLVQLISESLRSCNCRRVEIKDICCNPTFVRHWFNVVIWCDWINVNSMLVLFEFKAWWCFIYLFFHRLNKQSLCGLSAALACDWAFSTQNFPLIICDWYTYHGPDCPEEKCPVVIQNMGRLYHFCLSTSRINARRMVFFTRSRSSSFKQKYGSKEFGASKEHFTL